MTVLCGLAIDFNRKYSPKNFKPMIDPFENSVPALELMDKQVKFYEKAALINYRLLRRSIF